MLRSVATNIGLQGGPVKDSFSAELGGPEFSIVSNILSVVCCDRALSISCHTQCAYTRSVADHMFRNYDGVLKVEGEVGNKKTYGPRVWGAVAEAGLAGRIVDAAQQLGSVGRTF